MFAVWKPDASSGNRKRALPSEPDPNGQPKPKAQKAGHGGKYSLAKGSLHAIEQVDVFAVKPSQERRSIKDRGKLLCHDSK
jgi:hypothetical protein